MDSDLVFVIGIIILAFAIPAIVSAISDGRTPRGAALMILIGGGLTALAVNQQPGGFQVSEIPDVFVRVIGRYLN
ncbi:hypothetical protein [Roseisalinus antarcticus]|uniref:50S ribosomal protein L35 n=1 Tax=Roseisalinus antarcticus TaxID=254357 RepID=A0A1Y5RNY8_9RHOB|nr:hypothetical protein [Roseisalinus antarcticus]SLN22109.1 hypothetical protein ROA7023_00612 [Roseisalinus antarcticus]